MQRATTAEPSLLGLRKIRFLHKLPDDALTRLARECRWRRYLSGQQVISRDSADRDVYLIVTGMVRATAFSAAERERGRRGRRGRGRGPRKYRRHEQLHGL